MPVHRRAPFLFSSFLCPLLINTLLVWYHWKSISIFKENLDILISQHMDHFPQKTSAFTGIWSLKHIVNISTPYPYPNLSPFFASSLSVVPHLFGEYWGYFEAGFYGFLMGFQGDGHFYVGI